MNVKREPSRGVRIGIRRELTRGVNRHEARTGMKRRDLLLLACAEDGCARISCQQVYMHCRDLARAVAHRADGSAEGAEWWAGEPGAELVRESPEAFFQRLGEALHGKRRLELTDTEWLDDGELRRRFEHLSREFHAAGGEVVFAPRTESAEAMA